MSGGPHVVLAGNVAGRERAGGHLWALAQWALGLQAAGVRPTVAPAATADALRAIAPFGEASGEAAVALLNVMGFLTPDALPLHGPRVFLDIDPGYPQMWRELGLADVLSGHDRFVTVGANVGRDGCAIPDCGVEWIHVPPPVDLETWTPAPQGGRAFTSVATWRNPWGTVDFGGATYGSRVHEFRRFLELPRLVDADFELALDIDAAETRDLAALERNGWRLVDPRAVAGTPQAYRDHVRGSRAEICVAQQMYVATRSGWISDRSVCYLASGKPVLAQDTGLADRYPVGEGLLTFSTLEEAAAGVEEIERDYERHSAAARALAEECFDARLVLGRLLERLGLRVGAAA